MDNYNLQQTDAKIQAILNKVQPVVDNNTVAGFGNGYAISTTAGATADKEVTINGFTPTIGGVFSVMFQNAFSASDPTLNVSNTGAKDLMLFGSALPAAFVTAGTILTLTYDGTNYNVIGRLNDITVKSTLESTDSPLLQDANGNFIKSTPAALASLLGVGQEMIYGDCNNITSAGVYTLKGAVQNQPFQYTTLVVYKRGVTIHQVGYDADNSQMAVRLYNGENWTSWTRCDNFGCNTASDLASLLGVASFFTQMKVAYISSVAKNTWSDSGISANAGQIGRTALVLISGSYDTGDNTLSKVWLLRCGYNGNHVAKTEIAASGSDSPNYYVEVSVQNGNIAFKASHMSMFSVALITNR